MDREGIAKHRLGAGQTSSRGTDAPAAPSPIEDTSFNPFRTPGLRPEDQSAFSPGGQFAIRGRIIERVVQQVADGRGAGGFAAWVVTLGVGLIALLWVAGAALVVASVVQAVVDRNSNDVMLLFVGSLIFVVPVVLVGMRWVRGRRNRRLGQK
jgi:hypothetical protein